MHQYCIGIPKILRWLQCSESSEENWYIIDVFNTLVILHPFEPSILIAKQRNSETEHFWIDVHPHSVGNSANLVE